MPDMHLEAQNIAVAKVQDTNALDKSMESEITRLARDNDMSPASDRGLSAAAS